MRLSQAIQDNNAGQPYNRLDLAQAVDYSPESSGYRTMITWSGRYGLTIGSYAAEKISLTDLGRSIVSPRTDDERNQGILAALKKIDLFAKFLERFDQAKLPRDDLLTNTLTRDFAVPKEDADGCLKILRQNLTDWGMLVDYGGNTWLRSDKLVSKGSQTTLEQQPDGEEPKSLELVVQRQGELTPPPPPPQKVFISHSKNQTIVEQIKTILEFGQFKSVIAEEVETASIPIPEKVFGLMKQCNSAIINISADEKEKDPQGTYRVNPNVLIEIGAAFLAYDKRVVLLTDRRVPLPSNLQGLYRCEYEGDELSFSTSIKLQKALAGFRDKA